MIIYKNYFDILRFKSYRSAGHDRTDNTGERV